MLRLKKKPIVPFGISTCRVQMTCIPTPAYLTSVCLLCHRSTTTKESHHSRQIHLSTRLVHALSGPQKGPPHALAKVSLPHDGGRCREGYVHGLRRPQFIHSSTSLVHAHGSLEFQPERVSTVRGGQTPNDSLWSRHAARVTSNSGCLWNSPCNCFAQG